MNDQSAKPFEVVSELPDKLVVSVHFPKAAGTTLGRQLKAGLGDAAAFDYTHDPTLDAARTPLPWPDGARLVHGHFRPERHAAPGRLLATFLREPVDNLISIYFFWQTLPPCGSAPHDRFLQEKPSLRDFARHGGLSRLMSETYFGGFDMGRFDFIGFHETRRADLVHFGRLIGLSLNAELHENRTPAHAERDAIPLRIRAELRDILAEDVAFYERMRARRRAMGGGDPAVQSGQRRVAGPPRD